MQMENLLGHKKIATRAWRKGNWAVSRVAIGVLVFGKQIFSDKWKSDVIYMPGDWNLVLDRDRGIAALPKCQMLVSIATWHAHTHTFAVGEVVKKKNDTPSGDGEIFDIRARIQLTIIGWQLTRPMWRLWECGGHRKNPLTVLFSCQPAKWVNNLCNQSGLSLFWHNYLPWHFQCISVFASELVWLLYVLCIRNTILFKTQSCCLNIIQFSWVAI